jgi:uncharacterized membrane protein
MPMFLFEMASCSADSVIYGVSILSTAYLLSLAKSTEPISVREKIFIALAAIALGLSKQVYGIILFLYLLIPAERFGNKRKFYLNGIFFAAVFLVSALGWMHFSKSGLPVLPYLAPFEGVDMTGQTEFIKNNPLQFMGVMVETLKTNLGAFFKGIIGVLGWLSVNLPEWFYYFYSAALLTAGAVGKINLKISHRVLMILGFIPTLLVTMIYLYTTWTPVGGNLILGFQGRYMIPCAFMFLCAFSYCSNQKYEGIITSVVAFTSAVLTICELREYFY